MRDVVNRFVVLGCVMMFAGITMAAQFPQRPVRLITPYPPGGGTDAVARPIAQRFSEAWGQPVVVDNRGSGGGVIAAQMVAAAPPDGYTLFLSTGAVMVSAPLMMKSGVFDPYKDFAPVGLAALLPAFLLTQAATPVNTIADVIAYAKKNPGKLTSGSSGTGGGHHFAVEMMNAMAGIHIVHVPYKGGGPAVVALLSGEITFNWANYPGARPHIQSGRIKAIATAGAKRSALMPQVPTMIESGLPDFEYTTWYGFFVPGKTPRALSQFVNVELRKTLADRAISEPLLVQGAEAAPSTPEELTRIMREEHGRWLKVIKAQQLKL